VAGPGATIFNGETSDSFHNFGFSQFVTFFHSVKSFTEYADKMNCYLYGPTYLRKVIDGTADADKVGIIFRKMNEAVSFREASADATARMRDYMLPLFYGSPRIPFAETLANPALTATAVENVRDFPFGVWDPEILGRITPETCYAAYIHLYHSFHSQGSTVNCNKWAMLENGHRWRMPFHDTRIVDILSAAPESWGRGLDFNNVKFPLKWVARNKIDFPYEVLEEGPHSYLYDVIEGFSLFAEIMYRSGVTPWFKEVLAERPYRSILSDTHFDLAYLDGLVDAYLAGREARGPDFNNLVSLALFCATGWY